MTIKICQMVEAPSQSTTVTCYNVTMSPTMTVLLIIFTPTLAPYPPKNFQAFDYCTINCGSREHAACKCKVTGDRYEVLTNPSLVQFRKNILWAHNYWRNHIASGKEHRPVKGYCGQAANMYRMNYDMELEHIARCHGIQSFVFNKQQNAKFDTCNHMMNGDKFGQNLKAYTKETANKLWKLNSEGHWYSGIMNVTVNTINKFPGLGFGVENFTQVVWGTSDLLGCVRVHNENNYPAWRFTLICNYGSRFHKVSNIQNTSVYERGLKCTQCPEGSKCLRSSEFPFLCGHELPIPIDGITAGSGRKTASWILVVMTMTTMLK